MINAKIIKLFLVACVVLYGCQKVTSEYYNYNKKVTEFNGSILSFLETQGYDSMALVMQRIPGMVDSLSEDNLTLFAVPNESFDHALENLNTSLRIKNKPLMSLATIDSDILDTLMCCYIFKGYYTADTIAQFENGLKVPALKYNYLMNFQFKESGSSGYTNGGTQRLILSDMNNSSLKTNWQNVQTQIVNFKLLNHCLIHELLPTHEFGFSKLASKVNNQLDENDNTEIQ